MAVTKNLHAFDYAAIRALGTTFKRDFTKIALKKAKEGSVKVQNTLAVVREEQNEIAYNIWEIEDKKEEIKQLEANLDKAIGE